MSSTVSGRPQEHPVPDRPTAPHPGGAFMPPQRPAYPGKAVSITGLVLGGVALLLSWIPLINNLAFVLGLAGLILGAIGLVLAIRRHGPKALSVIAVSLAAVAIVIVLVTQAAYGAVLDSVADALDEQAGTQDVTEPASEPTTESLVDAESQPAQGATDDAVEDAAEPAAAGVAVGDTATVGDYSVTVDAVSLDATEAVMAANTFNDAPENGLYATADLTVTYEGADEGMPLFDLGIELLGGDQRNYETYGCGASLGDVEAQAAGLRSGGSSSFQVCFDLPEAAVQDAQLRVDHQLDFGSDPVVWSIP